mmetsp:Transcript_27303/g.45520  ORF Transcript_27303/g.45520 Transcript_27303/m.45520 type:complete len:286 (-) Transcript_27303:227-1084(-)|eukprot:CAMPEP_0119326186 /NCGR_PEP_ID=MMETSP1333-20130426/67760_1 /TAXON_ID=418940 /ORGANISM="Scyphosphaera apsteinii, Strain RCC1455" /LENGTH=285 /DNA_ID=CAMNT_0007334421 /DNA_START=28 /DNA_END=885 /DNA_ORIENTATION=-
MRRRLLAAAYLTLGISSPIQQAEIKLEIFLNELEHAAADFMQPSIFFSNTNAVHHPQLMSVNMLHGREPATATETVEAAVNIAQRTQEQALAGYAALKDTYHSLPPGKVEDTLARLLNRTSNEVWQKTTNTRLSRLIDEDIPAALAAADLYISAWNALKTDRAVTQYIQARGRQLQESPSLLQLVSNGFVGAVDAAQTAFTSAVTAFRSLTGGVCNILTLVTYVLTVANVAPAGFEAVNAACRQLVSPDLINVLNTINNGIGRVAGFVSSVNDLLQQTLSRIEIQ